MLRLSVLDQTPIFHGRTPAETLYESIELARAAERFGYQRFWVAEHHSDDATACATPEILVTAIAAHTTRIRVGSGGVMLPHYSALKVAETFRMLHALFPGRIDLGIGRGPGAILTTSRALREIAGTSHNSGSIEQHYQHFVRQLRDLRGFLTDTLPEDHPYKDVKAMPESPEGPELWLLGASRYSAHTAGTLGMALCFAQFFHPGAMFPGCLQTYRDTFCPSPMLPKPHASIAVRVICAETEAEAQRLAASFWLLNLNMHGLGSQLLYAEEGKARFPSLEESDAYRFTDADREFMRHKPFLIIVGTPAQVKARLGELAETYGVEEIVVVNACPTLQARIRSYQLLAEAFARAPITALDTYSPGSQIMQMKN